MPNTQFRPLHPPQRCPLSHPWVRTHQELQAWLLSARKRSLAMPLSFGLYFLFLLKFFIRIIFKRCLLGYNLSQSPSLSVGACQPCSAAHYSTCLGSVSVAQLRIRPFLPRLICVLPGVTLTYFLYSTSSVSTVFFAGVSCFFGKGASASTSASAAGR